MKGRRGVSEVVSSIIMTGLMLAIGASIWNYANSVTTSMSRNYIDDTLEMLEEVNERFMVEHVCYFSGNTTLRVWIYNYGKIPITVDLYATITESNFESVLGVDVPIESVACVDVDITVPSATAVAVKAHSGRMNNAYYDYYRS